MDRTLKVCYVHAWSFHIFSILEHSYSVSNIICTCISSFWKKTLHCRAAVTENLHFWTFLNQKKIHYFNTSIYWALDIWWIMLSDHQIFKWLQVILSKPTCNLVTNLTPKQQKQPACTSSFVVCWHDLFRALFFFIPRETLLDLTIGLIWSNEQRCVIVWPLYYKTDAFFDIRWDLTWSEGLPDRFLWSECDRKA